MGGAPAIEWIRDGVGFTPRAAASFRRAEADWGREIDANSTYRDPVLQDAMYHAWERYEASGFAPALYPGHSRALPASESVHCLGEALDSDDWTDPAFVALMAEHGWIRTAAWDPTEQHHFEYQQEHDQHINDPAPVAVIPKEDDMKLFTMPSKKNTRLGGCYIAVGDKAVRLGASNAARESGGKIILGESAAKALSNSGVLKFVGRI